MLACEDMWNCGERQLFIMDDVVHDMKKELYSEYWNTKLETQPSITVGEIQDSRCKSLQRPEIPNH